MQIQRTIKAKRDRLIDEVNALQIERQKRIQFVHHYRAVREQLHVGLRSMGTPVCRFLKYGDVKHLQHAFFKIGKRSRKFTGEARKNIRQELNPAPGIHGNRLNARSRMLSAGSAKSSQTPASAQRREKENLP